MELRMSVNPSGAAGGAHPAQEVSNIFVTTAEGKIKEIRLLSNEIPQTNKGDIKAGIIEHGWTLDKICKKRVEEAPQAQAAEALVTSQDTHDETEVKNLAYFKISKGTENNLELVVAGVPIGGNASVIDSVQPSSHSTIDFNYKALTARAETVHRVLQGKPEIVFVSDKRLFLNHDGVTLKFNLDNIETGKEKDIEDPIPADPVTEGDVFGSGSDYRATPTVTLGGYILDITQIYKLKDSLKHFSEFLLRENGDLNYLYQFTRGC